MDPYTTAVRSKNISEVVTVEAILRAEHVNILTLGLVQRWGEVFPRWIPFLGGRRVPIPLAVVPASLVAVLVTTAGLMFVRLTLTGRLGAILGEGVLSAENWATLAPELLWPLWGAALGAATLAYYYRRRGKCEHCGRPYRARS